MAVKHISLTQLSRFWTKVKAYMAANYATQNVATTTAHGLESMVDKQYINLWSQHGTLANAMPISGGVVDGDITWKNLGDIIRDNPSLKLAANLDPYDNFVISDNDASYKASRVQLNSVAAYILRSVAVTITRNTTNCSAVSGALCYYIPELSMCFLTCRFTCNAFAANAAKVLGSISSTYCPGTSVALQAIHGVTSNSCAAYLEGTGGSSPGSINFKDAAAVASGDMVYVMGFWFV